MRGRKTGKLPFEPTKKERENHRAKKTERTRENNGKNTYSLGWLYFLQGPGRDTWRTIAVPCLGRQTRNLATTVLEDAHPRHAWVCDTNTSH